MFVQLAEYLPARSPLLWQLARQVGCSHAVSNLPPAVDDQPRDVAAELRKLQAEFAAADLELAVIETAFPWLHKAKLALPGDEAEVERARELIRAMGDLGIGVACYNWMAVFNWTRTATDTPTRGGATVTSYDHATLADAPLTEAGEVSDAQLWEGLHAFLERLVPVAEEAGVRLALHPDDPPISPIRGVARILRSVDAMERAVDLVPSPASGVTFCQGTFATMGAEIPPTIRRFGDRDKISFVHFRDVRGTPERFAETFHDDGQTDMFAALRTYHRVGFRGPLRPDHVPTMAGEASVQPGYDVMGRLFAVGYIKGLIEGVEATA